MLYFTRGSILGPPPMFGQWRLGRCSGAPDSRHAFPAVTGLSALIRSVQQVAGGPLWHLSGIACPRSRQPAMPPALPASPAAGGPRACPCVAVRTAQASRCSRPEGTLYKRSEPDTRRPPPSWRGGGGACPV